MSVNAQQPVSVATNDLRGIFNACGDAANELELATRAAVSHREKCAVVMGAAVAVSVALAEADAVSPALDQITLLQLKRICSGILSTLGLAVARARVYGQYSRAQKFARLARYRATEFKFDELRVDLETLERQLWTLTGAVGGLGVGGTTATARGFSASTGKRKPGVKGGMSTLRAGPDRRTRVLRGAFAPWLIGGDVRAMCAAGVDGSELWWASNRSKTLCAYDLFLQHRRTLDGRRALVDDDDDDGDGGGEASKSKSKSTSTSGGSLDKERPSSKVVCCAFAGGTCLGEVTAMASEESSALLWTGTKRGEVQTWDADEGSRWGVATKLKLLSGVSSGVTVTAVTPTARGKAWVGANDGTIVECEAPDAPEDRVTITRTLCVGGRGDARPLDVENERVISPPVTSASTAPTPIETQVADAAVLLRWGAKDGRRRRNDAGIRELIRFGPICWASADDGVLEAWDVAEGKCVAVCPHRDLGPCVALVPIPAASQLATVHASGATQLWYAGGGGDGGGGGGIAVGARAELLTEAKKGGAKAVAAAAIEGFLCVGLSRGYMEIVSLPRGGGAWGSTPSVKALAEAGGGVAATATAATATTATKPSPPARIKVHRSGIVLLRAVDGGGHVGIVTAGKFGSIKLWPVAELEAAVAAAAAANKPGGTAAARYSPKDAAPAGARIRRAGDASSGGYHPAGGSSPSSSSAPSTPSRGENSARVDGLSSNTALIPYEDIRLKKCVGEGSFGRVYVAVWNKHTEVAVKLIGPPASFTGGDDPLLKQQRGRYPGRLAIGATAAAAHEGAGDDANARATAADDETHHSDGTHDSDDPRSETTRDADEAAAAEVLDELEREVSIMARLRHPNIVLLLGAVRSPPAIVEEYCARGSLYSVLQRHCKPGVPPLEWRVRLQMSLGAAAGMCYLHACSPPIIHRDLKSPNLMVDRYFRVKVGDFNLSRVAVASATTGALPGGRVAAAAAQHSQGGLHSPRWMAPEVLRAASYSTASDVYSFAVVLWELRTMKLPWESLGQWQLMHAVVDDASRPPLDATPKPTFGELASYDALIEDAWAQEPGARPSFDAVLTRLQGVIDAHAEALGSVRGKDKDGAGVVKKKSGGEAGLRAAAAGDGDGDANAAAAAATDAAERGSDARAHRTAAAAARDGDGDGDGDEGDGDGDDDDGGGETGKAAEKVMKRIISRKRSAKLTVDNVPPRVIAEITMNERRMRGEMKEELGRASPGPARQASRRGEVGVEAGATTTTAAATTTTTTAPSASKPPPPRPGSARSDGESLAKLRQFIDRPSSASRRTANGGGGGGGGANGGDEKRSPAPSPAKSQMLRGLASRAERRQTAPP